MTMSRAQTLHEMGLSPQWKLRTSAVSESQSKSQIESQVGTQAPAPVINTPVAAALLSRAVAQPMQVAQDFLSPGADFSGEVARMGWQALHKSVVDCRACGLCAERQQAVFGVGDVAADWLFIGEGPGAEEDARGEPFVGQAGKLLDAMLAAIDLQRGKGVYIANAVKCRPPGNRTPEAAEIAACAPYLKRQIALLQPKVIVLLGRAAVFAVLGEEGTLAALRGKPFTYHDGERSIPVVVTYHPAYLLRTLPDKAKAWEDLCRARAIMREAGVLS